MAIASNSLAMLDWELVFTKAVRHIAIRALPNKAIVAIARKLLIAVWHVLNERASDKNAISEMVAFKLMVLSWKFSGQERGGLTSRQLVRYHLIRLKLGDDLPYLVTGKNQTPDGLSDVGFDSQASACADELISGEE